MTQRNWTAELVDQFAPSAARNPWGPLEHPGAILLGSMLFEIEQGEQRALMAVRRDVLDLGVRAEVVGLVSSGPLFHCAAMDRAAVMIASSLGADVLAMSTQVPALAKACGRHGWSTTGAILTKWVGVH